MLGFAVFVSEQIDSLPSESLFELRCETVYEGFAMENSCDLEERIGGLLFDEKSSDMTFVVQNISVPAHRAIVATSSEYFRYLEMIA